MEPAGTDSHSLVDDASLVRALGVFIASAAEGEEGVTPEDKETAGCFLWDVCATNAASARLLIEHGLVEAFESLLLRGGSGGRQEEITWGILASLCAHPALVDIVVYHPPSEAAVPEADDRRGRLVLPLALDSYSASANPDVLRELTRFFCVLAAPLSARQQLSALAPLLEKLNFVLDSSLQTDLLAHSGKLAYLLSFYSPEARLALSSSSLEARVMRLLVQQGEELAHFMLGRFSGIEYLLRCLEVHNGHRQTGCARAAEEGAFLCFLEELLTDDAWHARSTAATVAVVLESYLSLPPLPTGAAGAAACSLAQLYEGCLRLATESLTPPPDPALLIAALELLVAVRCSPRYPGPECWPPGGRARLDRLLGEEGAGIVADDEEMQQRFMAVRKVLSTPAQDRPIDDEKKSA